ncbi:hypothetical protein RBA09_25790 [Massilia sp. CCM 9029]|nr:hypothetical protein [Massilia sp. CCM 9029]MDQ1834144.1 hypothetical protein [Massilia sp. CCM 9029]
MRDLRFEPGEQFVDSPILPGKNTRLSNWTSIHAKKRSMTGFERSGRLASLACPVGPSSRILLPDLVQSGECVQRLFGLGRFDIPGIKDFTARVRPALGVRDPALLRVMCIGAVAVALQYGPCGRCRPSAVSTCFAARLG